MSEHTAHNLKVFKVGVEDFSEHVIKAKLVAMLKSVAQDLVNYIDGAFMPWERLIGGNDNFPVWEGQLHDATGVGVYVDGALASYMPTTKAFEPQYYEGEVVVGAPRLQAALQAGATTFGKGIWIVLFSAVPYAYQINTYGSRRHRGQDFFEKLRQTLLSDVINGLRPIGT